MSAHTARQGIFNVLTGRAVCPAPRPDAEAEGLLDAYRAEVLTELAEEADRRLHVGTSRTVRKDAVRRFLQLEASAARAAAKTEDAPAGPAPDPEVAADTTRRAQLLYAMATQGGHWKSGTVVRWYKASGYQGLGIPAARRDLAALRDRGHIHQHDNAGCRFYTTRLNGDSTA
ncbi:hypothetical protein [Streptomyces sp. OM5714]|uniref:hypothetical protein n=1 Tax=Streptomyces sp. OM5714 TaxID=2602736 RepID=UPI0013DCA5DE|nr:hypothetical protein [Streptomyces sp. OM5714]KAF2774679.1 hypothetical protein STPH1_7724 [Streptomyces sp. OM5714]